MTTHALSGLRFKEFLPDLTNNASSGQRDHYGRWLDIIQRYTNCQLTFPSDRLPAISAAAKLFNIELNDEYVAGMWRRNLEKDLLWFRQGPDPRSVKVASDNTYRCPTWSWASTDCTVHWASLSSESHIKVTDIQLSYVTPDTMGPIRDGWLQLRGFLRRISLTVCECTGDPHWQMTIGNVKFDCFWPGPRVIVDTDSMADHIVDVGQDGNLYCMHAGTVPSFSGWKALTQVLMFQLLDEEKGLYGRIGYAQAIEVPFFVDQLQKVQLEQSTFACEKYEEPFHHIRVI
jgi:hypothetical protein